MNKQERLDQIIQDILNDDDEICSDIYYVSIYWINKERDRIPRMRIKKEDFKYIMQKVDHNYQDKYLEHYWKEYGWIFSY